MKKMLHIGAIVALCTSIAGCGLLCIGGTATCGLSDEATYRLLHPKTYGQYWEKPGVTKEEWQRDWMACGGGQDGQYGVYKVPGMRDVDFDREYKKERERLDTCMQQKGYQFDNTKPY
ncbi:hypothetical protein FB599_2510 [Herbaspirillum sp. SJZ130]|nr:hypothetical protein FB599_2510 [Herbaspirillum sp. SJZ130]TQK12160.1 hypothetical protein FB598_2110 [Herbaspirillum sp. SJZ106]